MEIFHLALSKRDSGIGGSSIYLHLMRVLVNVLQCLSGAIL